MVLLLAEGHPASKLNASFIDQTSKMLSHGLLGAAEAVLMERDPAHFIIDDRATGHGVKKKFPPESSQYSS